MKIEVTYNEEGHHEATAFAQIGGKEIWCTCTGLASCGEAFFDDNFPDDMDEEDMEELRDAAHQKVKEEWDYDGSNWSEPVDEPENEISDDADANHQFAIVRTAFHGGGVRGYAVSEESAEEWIAFLNAGSDCKCGCFGVCPVDELENLPSAGETNDPYCLAL